MSFVAKWSKIPLSKTRKCDSFRKMFLLYHLIVEKELHKHIFEGKCLTFWQTTFIPFPSNEFPFYLLYSGTSLDSAASNLVEGTKSKKRTKDSSDASNINFGAYILRLLKVKLSVIVQVYLAKTKRMSCNDIQSRQ